MCVFFLLLRRRKKTGNGCAWDRTFAADLGLPKACLANAPLRTNLFFFFVNFRSDRTRKTAQKREREKGGMRAEAPMGIEGIRGRKVYI